MNIHNMLHYEEKGKIAIEKEETLRLIIGVLGLLLPFLLYFSVMLYSNYNEVLPSISHYYFTRGSFFLHLVVIIFSLLLIVYKGYDPVDFWVSSIAGLAGLTLLFFPTSNIQDYIQNNPFDTELINSVQDVAITKMKSSETETIHLISAALFFLSLAFMSTFLFTRVKPFQSKEKVYPTKGRIIQNGIYYCCGGLIILSIVIMILGHKTKLIDTVFYEKNHLTFWLECVALFAFAVSWLFKSNMLIKGHVRTAEEFAMEEKKQEDNVVTV